VHHEHGSSIEIDVLQGGEHQISSLLGLERLLGIELAAGLRSRFVQQLPAVPGESVLIGGDSKSERGEPRTRWPLGVVLGELLVHADERLLHRILDVARNVKRRILPTRRIRSRTAPELG
jgi:hypothetical protein